MRLSVPLFLAFLVLPALVYTGQASAAVDGPNIDALLKAAQAKHTYAMVTLAEAYEQKKDYVNAYFWWRIANLYGGTIDLRGDTGGPVDRPESHLTPAQIQQQKQRLIDWIQSAANQGDARAQLRLGVMYEHGYPDLHFEQNYFESYFWLSLADAGPPNRTPSVQGPAWAHDTNRVASRLASEERAGVDLRVKKWDRDHVAPGAVPAPAPPYDTLTQRWPN